MKRLTKSADNVVFTGTLGGIAEYMNLDPTIVRVIFVFLSFTFIGAPFILYIVLAVLLPKAPVSSKRNTMYGGHNYQQNQYGQRFGHQGQSFQQQKQKPRKNAEKIDDDDWSDF